MPAFEYLGPGERVYTGLRDASGQHVGTVNVGDRRFFDDAPGDGLWAEVDFSTEGEPSSSDENPSGTSGDDGPGAEGGAGEPHVVEHPADGTWSPVAVGEDGTWTQAAVTVLPPEPPETAQGF